MPSLLWPAPKVALQKLNRWVRETGFVWPEPCHGAELRGGVWREGAWALSNALAGTIDPKERQPR